MSKKPNLDIICCNLQIGTQEEACLLCLSVHV